LVVVAAVICLGSVAVTGDEYRTISASLRHETPLWYQTHKASGHPVGCGPTAWAIVAGYWKEHRGKSNLLGNLALPHAQVNPDAELGAQIEAIAAAVDTTYGEYRGDKYGRTTPLNMVKAERYVERRGYRASVEKLNGTEFDKFRRVKAWLEQDRPVIILINDPEHAFTTLHYPVIEKAELKQKHVLGKWYDRDVRYYVNMGNGRREWIWVREVGGNDHPHTGSFSMFLLNIE